VRSDQRSVVEDPRTDSETGNKAKVARHSFTCHGEADFSVWIEDGSGTLIRARDAARGGVPRLALRPKKSTDSLAPPRSILREKAVFTKPEATTGGTARFAVIEFRDSTSDGWAFECEIVARRKHLVGTNPMNQPITSVSPAMGQERAISVIPAISTLALCARQHDAGATNFASGGRSEF
jgi:hypothetical protein